VVDDLYKVLGVERDANEESLTTAIDRLTRQASALANVSPERSQQIREQLRSAKEYLLSGADVRERYDRDLEIREAEEAQRARAPGLVSREVYLLDNDLAQVVKNAAHLIRAGLYTAPAAKVGADLDRARLNELERGVESDSSREVGQFAGQSPSSAPTTVGPNCTSCGNALTGDAKFCGICGASRVEVPVPAADEAGASRALPSPPRATGLRVASWISYGALMCLGYLVLWQRLVNAAGASTSRMQAYAYILFVPVALPILLLGILVVWIGYRHESPWRRIVALFSTIVIHSILGYVLIAGSTTVNITTTEKLILFVALALFNWLIVIFLLESVSLGIVVGVVMGLIRAGELLYIEHYDKYGTSTTRPLAFLIVAYYLILVALVTFGVVRSGRRNKVCTNCSSPLIRGSDSCSACGATYSQTSAQLKS
jgi:uncharacterized membrane protein (DUF373 family)/RNA polymerase subunit RPABC4/transcription elongation factor Spt4